jgi:hypothetical protein
MIAILAELTVGVFSYQKSYSAWYERRIPWL